MEVQDFDRRTLLKGGGAAFAGLTVLKVAGPAHAFPGQPGRGGGAPVARPAADQPRTSRWCGRSSTPGSRRPTTSSSSTTTTSRGSSAADWRLEIGGLVDRPQTLTLDDLKGRPRREVDFTLECSGNTGLPFFIGGIGNARWAGAPLAPLLRRAGVRDEGIEVVFWGADPGEADIRDNVGVLDPDGDPTIRHTTRAAGPTAPAGPPTDSRRVDLKSELRAQHDARGRAEPDNLLCYEMNGGPLPHGARLPGAPDRPGLVRRGQRQVADAHRGDGPAYAGSFMARDYVTIREEERDGETVWTFANVRHDRLKSAPAKVTRRDDRYRIMGAAWGAPIDRVEVQIDDGRVDAGAARRTSRREGRQRDGSSPGGSGRCAGTTRPRASTRSRRGRSTWTATSSPRRTTRSSPARSRSGRATGRSPAAC